ncbi:hypothetical protein AA313_de0202204 [Arthrobotrys entomopaga]|nr:hypothetical protein AA313_de0202204 [Arthrobotrys entomopaga]
MSTVTHEYWVPMTCSGCSGAVERILGRWKNTPGLESLEYTTDLDTKKVTVIAPEGIPSDDILAKLQKVKDDSKTWKAYQEGQA